MALQQFPVISVQGKPFDRGQQHGSQAREQVRKNVDSSTSGSNCGEPSAPKFYNNAKALSPPSGNMTLIYWRSWRG